MEDLLLHCKEIGKIKRTTTEEIEWSFPGLDTIPSGWYRSRTFLDEYELWNLFFFLPKSKERPILMLGTKMPLDYSVQYNIHLMNAVGNMQQLGSGIMRENEISKGWSPDFNLAQPNIIRCTLRREIAHTTQPTALDESKPLKLISMDRLSGRLKDLLSMKETCDTTLKVMDKEYKAHKTILIAQSPVFAAMFVHDTTERQTGVINIPDCDPDSFQEFLEYLYCGKLEDVSFHSALHLYVTSDKYEVLELKEFCVKFLENCLSVENVCEIAVFSDNYDEVDLFSVAQNFFNENVYKIFETCEWEFLMKTNFRLANKLLKEMSKVKHKG